MPRLRAGGAACLLAGAGGLVVLLLCPSAAPAQVTRPPIPSGLATRMVAPAVAAPLFVRVGPLQYEGGAGPLRPAALSLLVPGLGQRTQGHWRGWIYLSLEVVGWAWFADRRHAAAEYRGRYRDYAWEVARVQASPRVDPTFPYYEAMSHWGRSGAFDSDPQSSGVQPEPDVTSYNGAIWDRAVGLFLGGTVGQPTDPGYDAALAYYAERAWGPEFLWDWSGSGAAMAEFAGLIEASDDRARQATNVLGVIIANHLVAAVDAYLSARGSAVSVELRPGPRALGAGARWQARIAWRPAR